MPTEILPFVVAVITDEPWPGLEASTGAGVARLLEAMLARAGVDLAAGEARVEGRIWISDRWQAEIQVAGERRSEEAPFDQGHHLLYRLTEFAARQLGGEMPEPVTHAFDDLQTVSPGAMLAYWAGLGTEGGAQGRLWRRAFELDSRLVAARTGLARRVLASNDAEGDARAAAGLVAGLTVNDAEAAAELGIGIWAGVATAGDAAEAVGEVAAQLLQAAVKANPQDGLAAAALAALMARRGATDAALDEALLLATHATQVASDDYRCWAALADVHRAGGDFKQAGFFYGFALKLEPDAPSVLKDAGACWLLARQPAQALPLIERALAVAPEDAENYGNLAFLRDLMGEAGAALEAARRAAALNPGDARLRVLLGDLANKAGQREEALDAWAGALEIDPKILIHPEGGNIGLPGGEAGS